MPPDMAESNSKHDFVLSNSKSSLGCGNVYRSPLHCSSMLQNLNALRLNNKFCDVEIAAGRSIVKAHRTVLSASSPYFQAMFSTGLVEEQRDRIEIHCIDENILTAIIDFIYTGEVCLSQSNVLEMIVSADMLQLKDLVSGCTDFLKNELHVSNAVGIFRFAEDHNFESLRKSAIAVIESHFSTISLEEEFSDIPMETLSKFLDSELLQVNSEYEVFLAVMKWIIHDVSSRKRFIFDLLTHVRLPLISVALLDRTINDCTDASLELALKSVRNDLLHKKGNLVPLIAYPRLCAKKNIFLIGGSKREMQTSWARGIEPLIYDTIERFDTYRSEWCIGTASMAIGRILPGVATLNGKIYVVGGEHDGQILANGELYDPLTNTWTAIASMVVPRCEFGLCALDGQLYALGGWVGEDIGGSIERYDSVTDEWHVEGELPEPRFSMGVVSYGGLIYIVGGCMHSKRHLKDLISFDPITGVYRTLAPMLEPRSQIGVAVLDGYLYVVGGINRDNDVLKSVERYSFVENKWTYVGFLQEGRASPAVAAAAGCLYVMGGDQTVEVQFYKARVTIESVEKYDPIKDKWETSKPLPASRSEAAAIVL